MKSQINTTLIHSFKTMLSSSMMLKHIQTYHPIRKIRIANSKSVDFKQLDELTYVLYDNRTVASFDLAEKNVVWYDRRENPVFNGEEFKY